MDSIECSTGSKDLVEGQLATPPLTISSNGTINQDHSQSLDISDPVRVSIRKDLKRIKKLCETTTCKVYLYKDLKTNKKVVIKKMKVEEPGCVEEKTEMKNECILLSKCNHPNIIKYYGAQFFSKDIRSEDSDELTGAIKEELWIKMEYAPKGSLGDLINKCKNLEGGPKYLSEHLVLRIFLQISLGIKHIHDSKIIHRDIKPDNIFLFGDDVVKIGDFGVSKIIKETIQLNSTLAGSPYYIAPEVFLRNYDSKADIWSMGVTMYELCSYIVPFRGRDQEGLKKNIFKQRKVDPLPSCFSEELNILILMLLKRKVVNRISIDEIIKRILELDPSLRDVAEVTPLEEDNISKLNDDWSQYDDNYFNCTVKTSDTVQEMPANLICVEQGFDVRKKHRINKFEETGNNGFEIIQKEYSDSSDEICSDEASETSIKPLKKQEVGFDKSKDIRKMLNPSNCYRSSIANRLA
ncbi:unnamed protein product [Moneuplotes crassus]|uniref:non-specific serine/threonine protein kinase n=1 Tax=Euplotes crassus TaxID=5936 RepID=A0AAD1UFG8_EUPCR|nr:unnamed protein product [Moneuplotes crassus]